MEINNKTKCGQAIGEGSKKKNEETKESDCLEELGRSNRMLGRWKKDLVAQLRNTLTFREDKRGFQKKEMYFKLNPVWKKAGSRTKLRYLQESLGRQAQVRVEVLGGRLEALRRWVVDRERRQGGSLGWRNEVLPRLLGIFKREMVSGNEWSLPGVEGFASMYAWGMEIVHDLGRGEMSWSKLVLALKQEFPESVLASGLSEDREVPEVFLGLCECLDWPVEVKGLVLAESDGNRIEKNTEVLQVGKRLRSARISSNNKVGSSNKMSNSTRKLVLSNIQVDSKRMMNSRPIYITLAINGQQVTGRHSTGADVSIIDWGLFYQLAAHLPHLKLKQHNYLIRDSAGTILPSMYYLEAQLTYGSTYIGKHKLFLLDTHNPVPTVIGLSIIQACERLVKLS
ncbi:hypothetical protein NEHOM01_2182 [Nematocida homosporus]|uniref:uncharacterized protein n=1 Tax=Nematocida homosporus TaxID=1912981 RepID=UPI002220D7EB|nr:uncharacterized protein NEHOM01_2182 [Nematocida homosporus]KAI5187446.1 hypothetical protein NEHOM01_2182 [Nematocida homosporus]